MEYPRRRCFWRTGATLVFLSSLVPTGIAAAGPALKNGALPIRSHDKAQAQHRRHGYKIFVRRRSLQQEDNGYEALPSFDGDVEAIFEMAMAKALKQDDIRGPMTPAPSPVYGAEGGGQPALSDSPSLMPSLAPSSSFVGSGSSDVPSLTPSMAPSAPDFSGNGGGSPTKSDYPSLVPRGWPTSAPPVLSIPSGVPSDAPSTAPSADRGSVTLGTLAPSISSQPTMTALLNPHSCSGENGEVDAMADVTYLMTLRFTYSLETTPSANVRTVVGEAEEVLQETLGPRALSCLNSEASEASIVALDSLPRDWIATERTCSPYLDSENDCTVVQGSMRFFLSESTAAQTATDFLGLELADILNSKTFAQEVAAGLLRTRFLSVEEEAPTVTAVGEAPPVRDAAGTISTKDEKSIAPTALIAAAGAAVVVFVGSVYLWKRSHKRNAPSSATQFAGSSCNDATDPPSSSPFSEMLPDAYQFNGNMSIMSGQGQGVGMSAILEDEEATIHSHNSSAIFMSETGFSEQAGETDTSLMSFDIPKSLYTRVPESPNLLGARKRNHDQVISADSGEDTSLSDVESSSVLDETTPDSPGRHGALPNPGGTITSLLDVPELVPPRPSARPQGHVDPSADDSMHADELLLFC